MCGLVNDALAGVMADTVTPFHKVIFLLDELAQLGHMTAIEDGISLIRCFCLAVWLFLQDMDQLKTYQTAQLHRQRDEPVFQHA